MANTTYSHVSMVQGTRRTVPLIGLVRNHDSCWNTDRWKWVLDVMCVRPLKKYYISHHISERIWPSIRSLLHIKHSTYLIVLLNNNSCKISITWPNIHLNFTEKIPSLCNVQTLASFHHYKNKIVHQMNLILSIYTTWTHKLMKSSMFVDRLHNVVKLGLDK